MITVALPDRDARAALEHDVLTALDPALNLQGMHATPLRERLRELRAARATG